MIDIFENNISPVFELKDDRFDVGMISKYRLNIDISKSKFQFTIINVDTNTVLWLEDYQFPALLVENQIPSYLSLIYQNHQFLPANFWHSIQIQVSTSVYTLIPFNCFKSEDSVRYLQLLTDQYLLDEFAIVEVYLDSIGANCIYAVDKELNAWFKNMYPAQQITLKPRVKTLLELTNKSNTENSMHLSFGENEMDVVVWKGIKLMICNHYRFRTAQDFEYFILMLCNELELLNHNVTIYLYNEITHYSEFYQVLERNFQFIHFSSLPQNVKFSQYFSDVLEHRYATLFALK